MRVDIRISPILLAQQPIHAPEGALHGLLNQLHNCAIAKSQAHTVVLECLHEGTHSRQYEQRPTQSRALLSRHLFVLGDFPLSIFVDP